MENTQDLTKTEITTTKKSESVQLIDGVTFAQDQYIALTALGGMIPDPEGVKPAIRKTTSALAQDLGVARETLYAWRKSIPDFWERVARKRKELSSKDRISNVWNGLYLKGVAGDAKAAAIYLANHDPEFRMPTEKRELDLGSGFADLVAAKRLQLTQEAARAATALAHENRKVIDVTDSTTE